MTYVSFDQFPGIPAASACTCTATSQKHRSFIDLAVSLRPARGKLQKLRPDAKNPAAGHEFKDRRRSSLCNAIRLVGLKVGALGNPANAMSSGRGDSQRDGFVQRSDLWTTTETSVVPAPSRALPPFPSHPPPPPPPPVIQPAPRIAERTSVKPPTWKTRPTSAFIWRAKTPVHRIGQFERAARLKEATGLGRMSSVSTIARQYRALVDYPDYLDVLAAAAEYTAQPRNEAASHNDGSKPRESTLLESPRRGSQPAPSPVSDDGTLVTFEEAAEEAPAARRFRIGLGLLARELESALDDGHGSSGLQIWIMIEAYERLRDHMAAMSECEYGD